MDAPSWMFSSVFLTRTYLVLVFDGKLLVFTFRPIFVPFQLISIAYAFKFRQQLSHMTELVWNGPLSENDLFLINSIDFDPRRQQPPNIPTTQESNLTPFPSSTCGYINEFCHEFGNRLTHLKSADLTYLLKSLQLLPCLGRRRSTYSTMI